MLERKVMTDLLNWKNTKNRKCLIVEGARQIGKSFIIREFGKKNYKYYVEINFFKNENYKEIFSGSLNGKDIESKIKFIVPDAKDMVPGETLIFLDEIQFCPNAMTALKFLTIDGRYDYIVSGSLYGLKNKEVKSYPVGYVTHLKMHSLDFEEFLLAMNVPKSSIEELKNNFLTKTPVHPSTHNVMLNHFKNYIVVGGMPEVVDSFVHEKNYNKVLELQKDILRKYEDDIQLYANNNEKIKIRACLRAIPKNLAQDYKKYRYSMVEPNGTFRKFAGSLEWLYDAYIISYCYNLSIPELPLEGNAKNDAFKVYMQDTGLLMGMLEEGSQKDILDGNLGIYKRAIYENIIADIFTKNNKKLYYFEHNSTLEIDFIIRYNNEVTGVEVKSGDNTKSKSLQSLINNWNVNKGIRLSIKNIGRTDNIDCYPIYMAMFL